jgi:DNA-binding PadR family transcriptional regulator
MKEADGKPSGLGARALLDDLDRADLSLQHQKSLVGFLEQARCGGVDDDSVSSGTSRRPVRSPEAAEEERHQEEALTQLASDAIEPVRQQVTDLERHRQEIFVAMAESGCFEGRWVGKGDRAVYLKRKDEGKRVQASEEGQAEEESQFELHEGPWTWVEGAPEGEDPRETLARGEVLDRRMHARNELCILLGVPATVVCLGASLFPGVLLLTLVAALVIVLLLRLRQGRRRLLDHIFTGSGAGQRKARELSALAQLDSIRRGDTDVPPLKELEEAFALEFASGSSASGKHPRHRVKHRRHPKTEETEKTEGATGEGVSGKESQESPGAPAAFGPASNGMTRAAVLLSLAGGEKNLGDLLAHIRAFSGMAFAPGPAELGECLQELKDDDLVRQTDGEPPFARYKITPAGGRELHARMPPEPAGSLQEYEPAPDRSQCGHRLQSPKLPGASERDPGPDPRKEHLAWEQDYS